MGHVSRIVIVAVVLVGALAVSGAALAQTGGLSVDVVDDRGQPISGATVTLSHRASYVKETRELTDENGAVRFPVLRPGAGYVIEVTADGFSPVRQDQLRVRIDDVLEVSVGLPKEIEERVRVSARRDVIDLESTQTSTKFSDEFVSDLPVLGRSYQNILTLTPGVQDSDGDGNPNVHGSRTRDFRAEVNGISNVDPLTGQWMSRINPNSIEEIEVIAAGAGVEFGRAQGGFARIIQKQGSNEHEGNVELLWRTSKLDGDVSNLTNLPVPDFDSLQPSVHFSGPLIKDRLWYRFSHEFRDVDQPIKTATRVDTTRFREGNHSDQLTWQLSPRNKLAFLYQSDPRHVDNFGISFNVEAVASQRLKRGGGTYALTWTAPYSAKLFVESRLAWQDLETGRFPMTTGAKNQCVNGEEVLENSYCVDVELNRRTGSYFRTEDDRRQRLTTRSQATLYAGKFWGADHQLKFGFQVENERYFRSLAQRPAVDYQLIRPGSLDPTAPADAFTLESFGVAFLQVAVPGQDDVRATGTNWSLYLEDQIKPLQNLTLTVGARIDREEINSEGRTPLTPTAELERFNEELDFFRQLPGDIFAIARGRLVNEVFTGYEGLDDFGKEVADALCKDKPVETQGNCRTRVRGFTRTQVLEGAQNVRRKENVELINTNFSPVLSIAWSPGTNGKTALKASAGRHYNNIPLIIPLQELEPGLTNLLYRIDLGSGVADRLSGFEPTVSIRGVDRNLRTPYQDEVTLAFERELWAETSFKLTYIRRKFRDQIQDTNINLATGDFGACFPQFNRTDPLIVPSPGMGQQVFNFFTGEVYTDTDPGQGDGRLDDCVGENLFIPANPEPFLIQRPDGIIDLYLQNPMWGDVFEIGNSNTIDYRAFVVELVRRQYRNWELQSSYTWSEAIGDGEDFFQELGNDPSLRSNVRGYQSYDQRHVAKLVATSITPWGVRLGAAITWQSGLPYSELVELPAFDAVPPELAFIRSSAGRPRQQYLNNDGPQERNARRNESYWNVDLKATREFIVGRRVNMQMSAEVFNALDDQTFQIYNAAIEAGEILNGNRDGQFRLGRQWQVGMKLAF